MNQPRRAPTPPTIIAMNQFTVHMPADPATLGYTMSREELADQTLHEYGGVRLSEWDWQPASDGELPDEMIGRCYAEPRADDSGGLR